MASRLDFLDNKVQTLLDWSEYLFDKSSEIEDIIREVAIDLHLFGLIYPDPLVLDGFETLGIQEAITDSPNNSSLSPSNSDSSSSS